MEVLILSANVGHWGACGNMPLGNILEILMNQNNQMHTVQEVSQQEERIVVRILTIPRAHNEGIVRVSKQIVHPVVHK